MFQGDRHACADKTGWANLFETGVYPRNSGVLSLSLSHVKEQTYSSVDSKLQMSMEEIGLFDQIES
jgi:hypothetical protein